MEEEDSRDFLSVIPEGFIAEVLALTSPRDACILSSVNSFFRSAAYWDSVWQSFIPAEYLPEAEAVVGGNVPKKEVYLHLCYHPLIIDKGNKELESEFIEFIPILYRKEFKIPSLTLKEFEGILENSTNVFPKAISLLSDSFWLDKWTGKKCYMLAAKVLSIDLIDSPSCWKWTSLPESRFSEAAELINVYLFQLSGKINTSILSRNTTYVAHLVFKITPDAYGFEYQPVEVRIGTQIEKCQTRMVYLDPEARQRRRLRPRARNGIFWRRGVPNYDPPSEENVPKHRKDGWFEVEIGEYYNEGEDERELEMSVMEAEGGNRKAGLIIQGIEIRPKNCTV